MLVGKVVWCFSEKEVNLVVVEKANGEAELATGAAVGSSCLYSVRRVSSLRITSNLLLEYADHDTS
jgi:hypothetical protein